MEEYIFYRKDWLAFVNANTRMRNKYNNWSLSNKVEMKNEQKGLYGIRNDKKNRTTPKIQIKKT